MDFKDKVVLITGASSGIGAATAIYLANLGASLSLTGRNVENLKSVAKKCKGGPQPFVVAGDVTSESNIQNVLESTIKHYGRLDVLVNNAGIFETGSMEKSSLAQYDRVMNVNVRSVLHLTMLAVPHLVKSKGNIVNVSSINGLRSFANVLVYCMSKATLDQFTKCTALELAPKQVRVNSVNPGVIATEIFSRSGMDEAGVQAFLERAKETHPLQRHGQPEEVAAAIAFLASDLASNTTGVTLSVDGGRHALCPR